MGSFSFTRADLCTRRSNFIEGDKYKMLIPKEFGGGYIIDTYFDYGKVFYEPEWGAKYVDAEGNEYLATHLGFKTGDYVPPANNNGIITGTIHNAKYDPKSGRIEFNALGEGIFYNDYQTGVIRERWDLKEDFVAIFYDYTEPSLYEYLKSAGVKFSEETIPFKIRDARI